MTRSSRDPLRRPPLRHRLVLGTGLLLALLCGLVLGQAGSAVATPAAPSPTVSSDIEQAEPVAKKCSFDSDCPYGKCRGGACGGCSFNSDCKGWGVCKNSFCGGCSFNSECKGFGECKSNHCTKAPY